MVLGHGEDSNVGNNYRGDRVDQLPDVATREDGAKKMATVETVALLIEWTVYMRKTE